MLKQYYYLCFFLFTGITFASSWTQISGTGQTPEQYVTQNHGVEVIWGYQDEKWFLYTAPDVSFPNRNQYLPLNFLNQNQGYWIRSNFSGVQLSLTDNERSSRLHLQNLLVGKWLPTETKAFSRLFLYFNRYENIKIEIHDLDDVSFVPESVAFENEDHRIGKCFIEPVLKSIFKIHLDEYRKEHVYHYKYQKTNGEVIHKSEGNLDKEKLIIRKDKNETSMGSTLLESYIETKEYKRSFSPQFYIQEIGLDYFVTTGSGGILIWKKFN